MYNVHAIREYEYVVQVCQLFLENLKGCRVLKKLKTVGLPYPSFRKHFHASWGKGGASAPGATTCNTTWLGPPSGGNL